MYKVLKNGIAFIFWVIYFIDLTTGARLKVHRFC